MAKAGTHGVSANTPKSILFGAGTIHKGLKYSGSKWNIEESIVGSTSGGSKLTIKPELKPIEIDGAVTNVKGLVAKIDEKATLEVNFAELTKDIVTAATLGGAGTCEDTTYDVIESKDGVVAGDYWENIGFVGKTLEGKLIIAILDNALCTSGLENEGKPKDNSVGKYVFECHADPAKGVECLPWHIYYPKVI